MNLTENIELLNSFREYKTGWLGLNSDPIQKEFIDIAISHVGKFLVQPDIIAYDNGIQLRWALNQNDLIEIDISDNIEFVVFLNDTISVDQVIEAKFVSQYANRVLKQQLKNA